MQRAGTHQGLAGALPALLVGPPVPAGLQCCGGGRAANLDPQLTDKLATMGAMNLYLDFINLFLFLLRIFGGGSRD